MANKKLVLIFVLLFIPFILAECVDINTASADQLDVIKWVGPATAENIINTRPFDSVDDLLKVSGIGEIKLQDIKDEGIACVKDTNSDSSSDSEGDDSNDDLRDGDKITYSATNTDEKTEKDLEPISINPKDINTESYKQKQGKLKKSDYALYGLIIFGVGIIILFLLRKDKYQNEFR
jgi:hypothetical protein